MDELRQACGGAGFSLASGISQLAYGHERIIKIEELGHIPANEIPFILLLGVLVGIASTIFSINKTRIFWIVSIK